MYEKIRSVFIGSSDKSGLWTECCTNRLKDFCKIRLDERVIEIRYKLVIQLMTKKEMGSLSKSCPQIPNFHKECE